MYELSKTIQTPSVVTYQPDYPSAAFLSATTAFVSDGHGCIYVLDICDTGPAKLLGVHELPADLTTNPSTPSRIHAVSQTSASTATMVLSSRYYADAQPEASANGSKRKDNPVQFDVWAAQFLLPFGTGMSTEEARPLNVIWRRRGDYVPISVDYDASLKAHSLVGGSVFRSIGSTVPPSYEPSADEIAPIPRAGEQLDTKQNGTSSLPPYSWIQTNDEVTVAFPLPSTTEKSSINVSFSSRTLTVHIQTDSIGSVNIPHYSMKQLWDVIQPPTSFWTWDRNAEDKFGLLTLHLDKQNDGTRWMHVFASVGTSVDPQDPTDIEVPETLDPSELWKIRESLEKYTRSLQDGEDSSGLGLGAGIPSLADGEMDDEVDAAVGRQAYITWVGADGSTLDFSDEVAFNLLSTVLPGAGAGALQTSIVVKHSLDGAVFSFRHSETPAWVHDATFSALAFVLASKQDTRFTYHIPSKVVLAFENGSKDRGGNLYVYRSAPRSEKWAKQAVLKVGDGSAGSLLGVGCTQGQALLCLCEAQLVVIHGIF